MPRQPIILDEWIPVETELGKGYAFMIETENHDNWYTIILANRAIVTLPQEKFLVQKSYTHSRGTTKDDMVRAVAAITEKLHGTDTRGQDQGDGKEGPRLVRP
jgi:hypothetical protein